MRELACIRRAPGSDVTYGQHRGAIHAVEDPGRKSVTSLSRLGHHASEVADAGGEVLQVVDGEQGGMGHGAPSGFGQGSWSPTDAVSGPASDHVLSRSSRSARAEGRIGRSTVRTQVRRRRTCNCVCPGSSVIPAWVAWVDGSLRASCGGSPAPPGGGPRPSDGPPSFRVRAWGSSRPQTRPGPIWLEIR